MRTSTNLMVIPCLRAGPESNGGRDRVRTGDPLLAKQVLSQLSYTPIVSVILLISIPVAGVFRITTNSPFLGTFGTTSFGNAKPYPTRSASASLVGRSSFSAE